MNGLEELADLVDQEVTEVEVSFVPLGNGQNLALKVDVAAADDAYDDGEGWDGDDDDGDDDWDEEGDGGNDDEEEGEEDEDEQEGEVSNG